jgi:hypothetical protein
MTTPLMPKATAVWLIEHTSLTFEQIANFCNLHILEVEAIADTDPASQIVGFDSLASGQLSLEEIHRCERDQTAQLNLKEALSIEKILGKKASRYTPIAKRKDRPDAIFWLLKYCPSLSEKQICSLVNTTKITIDSIRKKEHWNMQAIRARHPVHLGLCSQEDLDSELEIAHKRNVKTEERLKEKSEKHTD